MRAMLTGVSGFVAARLAAVLGDGGWELGLQETDGADCVVHFSGAYTAEVRPDDLLADFRALEGALETAVRQRARFVLVSSAAVSGKPRLAPLDEESPSILEANSNELDDTVAGLVAEHLCFAYRAAFGLNSTVVRLFGAYGSGQPLAGANGGIAEWIAAALQQQPMRSPENSGASCCLSHADDLARGILLAMQSGGADGEIVHLADSRPVEAGALARRIWRLAGNAGEPRFATNAAARHKLFRAPVDSTKAQRLFGFAATMDHERGLAETIRWQARCLARP